jgi:hypothetical protein
MAVNQGIPRVKGLAFRGMLGSLRRVKGDEAVRRVFELLPTELARRARADLFVTQTWYPLSDYARVLHAIVERSGGDTALIRALSREAVLNDFRGVYRLLTFILSPRFVMKRGPMVFSRYYDSGKVVVEAEHGQAQTHYTGCKGFDHLLWNDLVYGSMALLEACGARDGLVRFVTGGQDGDDNCTARFTWR